MKALEAGFGHANITPPLGTNMAGYFEPHVAKEVVSDLFARAAAFRDAAGQTVMLVSCDVLFISQESAARIRSLVEAQTGVPGAHVLVAATHNHTGPTTTELFDAKPDPEYLASLERNAADAAVSAFNDLRPAALAFGLAEERRVNINRRLIMRDGRTHTHVTDADMADVLDREGTADPQVGVLAVNGAGGGLRGLLVNFALHPTNVRGDRVCADFPGYLGACVSARLGAAVETVFLNGACGNTDSKTDFVNRVEHGPERARLIADTLAETVTAALGQAAAFPVDSVAAASKVLTIPLRYVDPDHVTLAHEVLSNPNPAEWVFSRGTLRPSLLKEQVCAREALMVAELRAQCPYAKAEVQALRLGELAVVGIPVELFSEYGEEIKAAIATRFRYAMVVELANGALGYVPTRRAFAGGGYETRVARSSQLAPEAGEMLVAAARELIAGF